MITCQSEVRPANKFMYVGMLRMKKKKNNKLTVLDCIQRCHIAAKGLHAEDGNLVSNISTG